MPVPDALAAMVVPQPITAIATWVSLLISALGFVWCLRHLARTGEKMPLFLLAGGAIASLLEPLYDVTALIWHPTIGQWTAFHLFGRDLPVLMPAGWCWNVGGGAMLLWLCFSGGRITGRNIWLWFAAAVVLNMLFEIPGTSLGVYAYYGHQPLVLTSGSYSLPIAFGNGAAALTIAFLAWRLAPLFQAGLSAWVLGWFITPFGFWIGSGPGWIPVMMAANATQWSRWSIEAMGLVSMALSLALVGIYSRIMAALPVAQPAPRPRDRTAPGAIRPGAHLPLQSGSHP